MVRAQRDLAFPEREPTLLGRRLVVLQQSLSTRKPSRADRRIIAQDMRSTSPCGCRTRLAALPMKLR
jgi:hypothetical protein